MADFGGPRLVRSRARETDREIADQANDRTLMCCAGGCPLRWSVDIDGRYCSAHAWADPQHWDRITKRLLHALADQAAMPSMDGGDYRRPPTDDERRRIRAGLRELARRGMDRTPRANRAWAHDLLARIRAGQIKPTQAQRDALSRVIPGAFDSESEAWGEAA